MDDLEQAQLNRILLDKGDGLTAKVFRDVCAAKQAFMCYAANNGIPSNVCAIADDEDNGFFSLRFIAEDPLTAMEYFCIFMEKVYPQLPKDNLNFSYIGGSAESFRADGLMTSVASFKPKKQ